jgi:PAS domain S-box-containing protein
MSVSEPLVQASLIGEAIDQGPALVFVADEDMRYAAVNAYACELLGYTREELLGMAVTDVARYPEAEDEYEELQELREREGSAELTRKDGSTFPVRYLASTTTIAGMPYYVSICRPE